MGRDKQGILFWGGRFLSDLLHAMNFIVNRELLYKIPLVNINEGPLAWTSGNLGQFISFDMYYGADTSNSLHIAHFICSDFLLKQLGFLQMLKLKLWQFGQRLYARFYIRARRRRHCRSS